MLKKNMSNQKKTIKQHLMEIFFKKDFIDRKDKKEAIKQCFKHDLIWALGFGLFLLIAALFIFFSM